MTANIKKYIGYSRNEWIVVGTVLLAVGLLAGPAMLRAQPPTVEDAARLVMADLLVARNEAMVRQAGRSVTFDLSANGYQVSDAPALDGSAVVRGDIRGEFPAAVWFGRPGRFAQVSLARADFGGEPVCRFNAAGVPVSGGEVELVWGDVRCVVRVEPLTGRVSMVPAGRH